MSVTQKNIINERNLIIMSVIATTKSYGVRIKLNAGSTESGKVITNSVSLGTMAVGADQNKIMAVANLLEPVLENPIYAVEETTVKVLSE